MSLRSRLLVVLLATMGLLSGAVPAQAESKYPPTHKKPSYCGYGNRAACEAWTRYDRLEERLYINNWNGKAAAMYTLLLPVERAMMDATGLDSGHVVKAYLRNPSQSCRDAVHRAMIWLNYDLYKVDRSVYNDKVWFGLLLGQANPVKISGVSRAANDVARRASGSGKVGWAVEQAVNEVTHIFGPYKAHLDVGIKVGQGTKYRSVMQDRVLNGIRPKCQI